MPKFTTVPYEPNPQNIHIAEILTSDDETLNAPLDSVDWVFESKQDAINFLEQIISDLKEES